MPHTVLVRVPIQSDADEFLWNDPSWDYRETEGDTAVYTFTYYYF